MTEQEFLQFMREKRERIKAYQERSGSICNAPEYYDEIPEDKIYGMGDLLLKEGTQLGIKEDILMNFAHQSSETAMDFLGRYKNKPDEELKIVADLAFDECEYFTN